MANIVLSEKESLEYIKSVLNEIKSHNQSITDAKYHHNSKYSDAVSIIKNGILPISYQNQIKIRNDSEEFLKVLADISSHVNGIDGVSLAVSGLDDLYPDEIEYYPDNSDMVDFRVSSRIHASRTTERYGNEFVCFGAIHPSEFKSIDIRLLKYIYQIENGITSEGKKSIKGLEGRYNVLGEIVSEIRQSGLYVPIREVSNGEDLLDLDLLVDMPKILIK